MQFCSFWLPANSTTWLYKMETHIPVEWNAVSISIYDSGSGGTGWIQVDNVSLRVRSGLPRRQTYCAETGSSLTTPYAVSIVSASRNWSTAEVQAIHSGVNEVGSAFFTIGSNPYTPQETFNRVMVNGDAAGSIFFIRMNAGTATTPGNVTITPFTWSAATVTYDNIDLGYCKAFQGSGSTIPTGATIPTPRAVVCNGPLLDRWQNGTFTGEATVHTIVHELGHLFDNRSGTPPPGGGAVQGGVSVELGLNGSAYFLGDCTGQRVIGLVGNSWERGERGWGSGPAKQGNGNPLITDFQQSPVFEVDRGSREIDEAAADMFLNWVYRVNYDLVFPPPRDTCILDPRPTYNHWNGPGFRNASWAGQTAAVPNSTLGNPDAEMPGDRRFFDMHRIIRNLFSNRGW